MNEYHKIQTVFKRDMETKHKTLLEGQWTLPEFEYLANNKWTFTEKVDGTNIRVMLQSGVVTFGGKTDSAQIPAQLVARLNERFLPLAGIMQKVFDGNACLYGEGYGAKIQKGGGNYRSDQDFILFDVRVGDYWLQREDVEDVAANLGIDVVPIIGEGTLHDAIEWAKRGIPSTWGTFEAEGIVARPKVELKTRDGKRIITKIKCQDFFNIGTMKIAISEDSDGTGYCRYCGTTVGELHHNDCDLLKNNIFETIFFKEYKDGIIATGKAPLPELSPTEQETFLHNCISRSDWHNKAWELYRAKTLNDHSLAKLNIHTLRNIFDCIYDAFK